MRKHRLLTQRVVSVLLIVFGLLLGITWNTEKFCIGDAVFAALELPAWSTGTSGTHYPAIIGSFAALIGIGMLNLTLPKKSRIWLWALVVLLLILLNALSVVI